MSKNTWILWALLLMIPGVVGLVSHFAQRKTFNARIAVAVEATSKNTATEEYLGMYEKWFGLSPQEKAENPWGQDPYGGPDIQKRLSRGQSDRLLANIADLDKGIRRFPEELSETLYGAGWEGQLEDYRRQCSSFEMILIGSVFLVACSGLILIGGAGKIFMVYGLSRIRRAKDSPPQEQEAVPSSADSDAKPEQSQTQPSENADAQCDLLAQTQPASDMEKVIVANRTEKHKKHSSGDKDEVGYFQSRKKKEKQKSAPLASETPDTNKTPLPELPKAAPASFSAVKKTAKDNFFGWALNEEPSSDMETLMTTEPLTKELTELTEEVSAIRQFAAQQQDQVRKLQDGYDWMIIRRFCMRIIRSIDNIEDRITRLNAPESEIVACLQDIRDELVFSLESSGIEQFSPELKAPYKGLEKYAEAVSKRVPVEDEALSGCIAEIVRPGYQYLISDDDVKIVRCAQVKLYDAK